MRHTGNGDTGAAYSRNQAISMLEFVRRVKQVFVGSVLVVVALVFFLVFRPMEAELKHSLTDVFEQMSRTNHYVVENTIERCIEGAKSLSSRTMIKNAIGQYRSGQMSLEELKTYTHGKYEDGASAIDHIVLAQRIVDDDIVASYRAGDEVLDMSYTEIDIQQEVAILPQLVIRGGRAYVAMNSPVKMENQVVGHDFVIYDITKQIEALCSKNMEAYLMDDRAYRELFDASEATEHDGARVLTSDGLVYWACPIANMYFASTQAQSMLYEPITRLGHRVVIGGTVVFAGYTLVVYVYIFLYLRRELGSLESSRDAYKEMAYIDHLTGAYSRQFLDIWDKSVRSYRENYALVVIDVDDFKEINDVHGHSTGDRVLQHLAATIAKSIRRGDVLVRYGGDEFVLVLSGIDAEGAQGLLARVEARVTVPVHSSSFIRIRFSYGMSMLANDDDLKESLERADMEMYESKRAKKNGHQASAT